MRRSTTMPASWPPTKSRKTTGTYIRSRCLTRSSRVQENRGISVALAFDPPVRSSRKEYLARTMWVEVMKGLTLHEIEGYRTPYSGEGKPPKFPSPKLLTMRPNKTALYWSTLQVRRKKWRRFPGFPTAEGEERPTLHVLVGCQRRFFHGEDPRQTYGLAVRFWHEDASVALYQELRANVRARLVLQAQR